MADPSPVAVTRSLSLGLWLISSFCLLPLTPLAAEAGEPNPRAEDTVRIHQIEPDPRGGKAVSLKTSCKCLPRSIGSSRRTSTTIFWSRTDTFANIISFRAAAIRSSPRTDLRAAVFFEWQTTVEHDAYRLAFVLLNPLQCGQKFHYGTIQLESVDKGTKVTQVAYFDFVGASFWAYYPWGGGMVDFLTHLANWEQDLVVHLKDRYSGDSF
ncbi:MAG: hypothetical protein U5J82_14395 [Desulfobacterales bacterium]|nr:hypothetical protein [Desulfobacterales bacterium]